MSSLQVECTNTLCMDCIGFPICNVHHAVSLEPGVERKVHMGVVVCYAGSMFGERRAPCRHIIPPFLPTHLSPLLQLTQAGKPSSSQTAIEHLPKHLHGSSRLAAKSPQPQHNSLDHCICLGLSFQAPLSSCLPWLLLSVDTTLGIHVRELTMTTL